MRGEKEVPGWKEGLRIVFEELDVDRVGGDGGVLDFAQRIRNRCVHSACVTLDRVADDNLPGTRT